MSIEHDAIVVDVGVALHHEAVGEAEVIEQRDQPLDRRVGRRIGAARLIGKLIGRLENMEVRVPRARRRQLAGLLRLRHRTAMRGGSSAVAMPKPQPNMILASLTTRLHSAICASM